MLHWNTINISVILTDSLLVSTQDTLDKPFTLKARLFDAVWNNYNCHTPVCFLRLLKLFILSKLIFQCERAHCVQQSIFI